MGLMSGQFRLMGHAYFLEVGMEGKGTVKVGGGGPLKSVTGACFLK